MKTVYLNWRGPAGLETVDEVTLEDMTRKEYRAYVSHLITEYGLANMLVYASSRPCKAWKDKEAKE